MLNALDTSVLCVPHKKCPAMYFLLVIQADIYFLLRSLLYVKHQRRELNLGSAKISHGISLHYIDFFVYYISLQFPVLSDIDKL